MKIAIAAGLLDKSGLRYVLERLKTWSGIVCLGYHRIGDADHRLFDHGLWSATADAFAEQVRFCRRHFELITPEDLATVAAHGKGQYAMITFDDGYRDNYETAVPILRAEGVRATFFVVAGFIDAPRVAWWDEIAWMVRTSLRREISLPGWLAAPLPLDEPDREAAVRALLRSYKKIPSESCDSLLDAVADATGSGRCGVEAGASVWMTWDMLREMQASGMIIGGHTMTHPVLARASRERQRQEIGGCGQRLADELGVPMRYLSYPVGGLSAFDSVTRDCLREAGVRYAFSYYGGFRRFDDWDDHDIRRVPVENDVTRSWFRSILTIPSVFA